MTLSLVTSNVTDLPVGNLKDTAAMMRRVADQIEAGEHGEVENATLVLDSDLGVMTFHWGLSGNAHERIGLLESAKYAILASLHGDDGE